MNKIKDFAIPVYNCIDQSTSMYLYISTSSVPDIEVVLARYY